MKKVFRRIKYSIKVKHSIKAIKEVKRRVFDELYVRLETKKRKNSVRW